MRVENLTPGAVPANPSGVYTFSAKAVPKSEAIDRNSITTSIVIDGEEHVMAPSASGRNIFDFEYAFPEDRQVARFYYTVNFRLFRPGMELGDLRQVNSAVQEVRLVDRFTISIETERAPVGTPVAVLGRGFRRSDRIHVGGVPADTRFVSENSLVFIVPAVATGAAHPVEVVSGSQRESAGVLRVDAGAPIRILPSRVSLAVGERATLAVSIDFPAPPGGLNIVVETDIPDSVIMPEVRIPAGERSVSVTVEGGAAGSGALYIRGPGLREVQIPVQVGVN